MDALCTVIAEKGRAAYIPAPLVHLIWTRLRNLVVRFLAAVARGPVSPRKPRPAAKPAPEAAPESTPESTPGSTPEPDPNRPARRKRITLPRRESWLYRLLPETGFVRFTLQHLLSDPEFAGLLQANPALIRILTPLYNAMGIDLPTEPPFGPDPPPDSRRHILFGASPRNDPDPEPDLQPPPIKFRQA
jgi:hypothetical protein